MVGSTKRSQGRRLQPGPTPRRPPEFRPCAPDPTAIRRRLPKLPGRRAAGEIAGCADWRSMVAPQTAAPNVGHLATLPEHAREQVDLSLSRGLQFVRPLFEFSSACAGCGEAPYLKLLSQLFGDRLQIANATGCTSIYGGNLPSLPWRAGPDGRGPAWSNSLFEDNAEFGLGMRLAVDQQAAIARALVAELTDRIGPRLAQEILDAPQRTDSEIVAQRARVVELRRALGDATDGPARNLLAVAEHLVRRSLWIVGGDGWAYDIGAGGLDHVLAQNRNVNVLVLDTEVYSNTGGQSSKATSIGASAKFAAA